MTSVVVQQLIAAPRQDNRAVLHDVSVLGDLERLADILLHQQDRQAAVDAAASKSEKFPELAAAPNPSMARPTATSAARAINARAIASICCSPPERLPAAPASRSCKRGNSSSIFTKSLSISTADLGADRRRVANSPGPSSVARISRPSATWTSPSSTIWCGARPRNSLPSNWIEPALILSSPDSASSVVDLPAPLAPSKVTIWPSSRVKLDAFDRFDGAVAHLQIFNLKQRAHDKLCTGAPSSALSSPR